MNTGLAYWCLGRLDEARSAYDAALARYRQTGSGEASYALIGLGDVYRERGDLALARAAYEEGLALAESTGDLQGVVPGLYQLAKVLVDDDPERATSLAERAVAHGWPDPAWALNAAGWVALVRGDRKRAAEAARGAEAVAREQRDGFGLAEALELRALTTEDAGAARTLLADALAAWREIGNSIHEATVELGLARLSSRPDARAAGARAERRLHRLGIRVSPTGSAGLLRLVSPHEGPFIAVQALGGFTVLRDGQPVALPEWRSKKARDLFQILVSRMGRPVQRELVMEALWPGEDASKLGNRLSVALSTLRGVLDPERRFDAERFVAGDRQTLVLRTEAVAVDVEAFFAEANAGLAAHATGRTREAVELLASAEAAYAGDFLEEVYDDWAVSLREEARTLYVDIARALAEIAGAAGELDEAARYLLRILSRDGHDERAHLDLVRALTRAGRHGEARRQYRSYVERMEEIGVEPAPYPATAALRV
jgi:DNA-binding SARP family transcriptional activator